VLFLYANTEEKEKEKIKIEAPILLPFEPWLPNFLLLSTILCRVWCECNDAGSFG